MAVTDNTISLNKDARNIFSVCIPTGYRFDEFHFYFDKHGDTRPADVITTAAKYFDTIPYDFVSFMNSYCDFPGGNIHKMLTKCVGRLADLDSRKPSPKNLVINMAGKGAGKSEAALEYIEDRTGYSRRCIIVAPRRNLVEQIALNENVVSLSNLVHTPSALHGQFSFTDEDEIFYSEDDDEDEPMQVFPRKDTEILKAKKKKAVSARIKEAIGEGRSVCTTLYSQSEYSKMVIDAYTKGVFDLVIEEWSMLVEALELAFKHADHEMLRGNLNNDKSAYPIPFSSEFDLSTISTAGRLHSLLKHRNLRNIIVNDADMDRRAFGVLMDLMGMRRTKIAQTHKYSTRCYIIYGGNKEKVICKSSGIDGEVVEVGKKARFVMTSDTLSHRKSRKSAKNKAVTAVDAAVFEIAMVLNSGGRVICYVPNTSSWSVLNAELSELCDKYQDVHPLFIDKTKMSLSRIIGGSLQDDIKMSRLVCHTTTITTGTSILPEGIKGAVSFDLGVYFVAPFKGMYDKTNAPEDFVTPTALTQMVGRDRTAHNVLIVAGIESTKHHSVYRAYENVDVHNQYKHYTVTMLQALMGGMYTYNMTRDDFFADANETESMFSGKRNHFESTREGVAYIVETQRLINVGTDKFVSGRQFETIYKSKCKIMYGMMKVIPTFSKGSENCLPESYELLTELADAFADLHNQVGYYKDFSAINGMVEKLYPTPRTGKEMLEKWQNDVIKILTLDGFDVKQLTSGEYVYDVEEIGRRMGDGDTNLKKKWKDGHQAMVLDSVLRNDGQCLELAGIGVLSESNSEVIKGVELDHVWEFPKQDFENLRNVSEEYIEGATGLPESPEFVLGRLNSIFKANDSWCGNKSGGFQAFLAQLMVLELVNPLWWDNKEVLMKLSAGVMPATSFAAMVEGRGVFRALTKHMFKIPTHFDRGLRDLAVALYNDGRTKRQRVVESFDDLRNRNVVDSTKILLSQILDKVSAERYVMSSAYVGMFDSTKVKADMVAEVQLGRVDTGYSASVLDLISFLMLKIVLHTEYKIDIHVVKSVSTSTQVKCGCHIVTSSALEKLIKLL